MIEKIVILQSDASSFLYYIKNKITPYETVHFLFMSIFFFVGCSEQNDEISSEKNKLLLLNLAFV